MNLLHSWRWSLLLLFSPSLWSRWMPPCGLYFDQLWYLGFKVWVLLLLALISSIVLANTLLLPCRANLVPMWPDRVVLPFLLQILSYVKCSICAICSWVWAFIKSWVVINNPSDFWCFSEGVDRQHWDLTRNVLKDFLIVLRFTLVLDLQCNKILVYLWVCYLFLYHIYHISIDQSSVSFI